MLSKIEWPTALVVIVGISGLVVAAVLKVDKETITAVGIAAIGIAGAMKALLKTDDKKEGAQ